MAQALVVFYSRADENYVNGEIRMLSVGNTEIVADMLSELTGADKFKIEQTEPYSVSYNECIEQARRDQQQNKRPELKRYPDSLDPYSVIYLGYPNYWSTIPMAVFTFLEHFDFSGKIIKPFCTHEGSGLGRSVSDIKKLCPTADVRQGIAIHGGSAEKARKDIEKWILEQ